MIRRGVDGGMNPLYRQAIVQSVFGTALFIALFMPVLLWRLLDEEKILRKDLRGYTEYTQKVRDRLIPYVW